MATRLQIRSRSRVRADQVGVTDPSDALYNDWIDESAKETQYDLIKAGWPIAFQTATVSITVINQARLSDFGVTGTVAFIRGVFRVDGTILTELKRLNEGNRASVLSTRGGYAAYYSAMVSPSEGALVEILPLQAGSYVVYYISEFAGFAADGESWYGPARSDEMIILLTAIKALRKEGDDQGAAQLEKEYFRLLAKVTEMAGWYDLRNAPTIRDVGEQLTPVRRPFDFDV